MKVAEEILRQLGGQHFILVTGASKFCSQKGANYLEFRIPRNASKANKVKIELLPDDSYKCTFLKVVAPRLNKKTWEWSDGKTTIINECSGLYCDQLQAHFTEITGLYTKIKINFH